MTITFSNARPFITIFHLFNTALTPFGPFPL